jgi:Porin PorA
MNRRLRYVLVGLGLFLLFFGVIERAFVYPRLANIPRSVYAVPVAEGTASYFDTVTAQIIQYASLRNTRVVKGDRHAGNGKVAVWDTFINTVDMNRGKRISLIQERVAFDRLTAMPVHCCRETPTHEGLVLNFPFPTHKTSYPFWNEFTGRAYPVLYSGEEDVNGLRTYRFEQHIRGGRISSIDLPGSLAGRPGVHTVPASLILDDDKTIWVEPSTGRIIKGREDQHQLVQDASGNTYLTAFDGTLTWTDDTVASNVRLARHDLSQLRMGAVLLPAGGILLGVVLLVVGLLLPLRRPAEPRGAHEPWPPSRPDGGPREAQRPAPENRGAPADVTEQLHAGGP